MLLPTLEILLLANFDMCEGGAAFAAANEDPHNAITVALADRRPPEVSHMVTDYLGWEYLRYCANYLSGCEPCDTHENGKGPRTWYGHDATAEQVEAATVRAAVNLRRWLDNQGRVMRTGYRYDPANL